MTEARYICIVTFVLIVKSRLSTLEWKAHAIEERNQRGSTDIQEKRGKRGKNRVEKRARIKKKTMKEGGKKEI